MVEIKSEIPYEELALFKDAALKHLGEHLKLDGFRPGHIPLNMIEKNIAEAVVLEEMARMALAKEYPKLIKENGIKAIGYPEIRITKLAKDNPLEFAAVVAVLPEINLGDYKKIAKDASKEKESSEITEEEFEKMLLEVRTMKAREEAKGEELAPDAPLPEIDDAFVKKLGAFESLEDFKTKVRTNMQKDKEARTTEKNRLKIVENLIEASKMQVPEILIEAETEKIRHKIRTDIETMGLKYENYLSHLKKSEEDMKKEWRSEAEKRAKTQLIVAEIAKLEKISLDEKRIEAEVKKLTDVYKDVDPDNARYYIESVMLNEEVFKILES